MKKQSYMNKKLAFLTIMLLLLVLVTSGLVGKTFAKYKVSEKVNGTGRVAKFGITLSTNEGSIFSPSYNESDKEQVIVQTSNSEKLVAPGTKGSVPNITISGTTEVAVRIDYDIILDLSEWNVDGRFYCPLKFSINDNVINGTEHNSLDTLLQAIKEELAKCSKEFKPNASLADHVGPTITWEWAFDGDDELDTKLGQKGTDTIQLTLTTTVTQINTYQE